MNPFLFRWVFRFILIRNWKTLLPSRLYPSKSRVDRWSELDWAEKSPKIDSHGSAGGPFIINSPWFGNISAGKQIKNKLVNLIETIFQKWFFIVVSLMSESSAFIQSSHDVTLSLYRVPQQYILGSLCLMKFKLWIKQGS